MQITNYSVTPQIPAIGESCTVSFTVKNTQSWTAKRVKMWFTFMGRVSPYPVYNLAVLDQIVSIAQNGSKALSATVAVPNALTAVYVAGDRWEYGAPRVELLNADGTQSDFESPIASTKFLSSRVDPVINGMSFSDIHALDPLTHFGDYVQGKSLPRITGSVTLDPLDTTLTALHTLTLKSGETTIYTASNTTGVFEPGVITATGTIDWTYTVTDSAGNSDSSSGSFTVLPYAAAALATVSVERYKAVAGDGGGTTYVAADDGEKVRFTVSGDVSEIADLNAWALTIKYGVVGGTTTTITPLSGTDGATDTIRKTDDRTLLAADIPAANDYEFLVTLTDYFGSTAKTVFVYRAGGYFNVEKFGVAAGMRSTGTEENPLFESAYKAVFYEGIAALANAHILEMLGIQSGEAGFPATNGAKANAYTDVAVTFPTAYKAAPLLFLSARTGSTAVNMGSHLYVLLDNSLTASGFTARWYNNTANDRWPTVRWTAIGELDA